MQFDKVGKFLALKFKYPVQSTQLQVINISKPTNMKNSDIN